jgi:molybdopterin/thiamine biosynthesis adenylyltransferase
MDIYNRQKTLELKIPDRVSVIGVGGIGTWVALFAAMSGVRDIELSDPDTIDETNLNRLPFRQDAVGMSKAGAVAAMIQGIRPDAHIRTRERSANFDMTDFVFICTDNLESKMKYAQMAKDRGVPFAILGYDGNAISLSLNRIPVVWDNGPDGYRTVPSWVAPPAFIAAWAVDLAFSGAAEFTFDGDIRDVVTGRKP